MEVLSQADTSDRVALPRQGDDSDRNHSPQPTDINGVDREMRPIIAQESKLLSIPPELRNGIYGYVLLSKNNIEIPDTGKLVRPALLKTCRQITEEATSIYYALNAFHAYQVSSLAGPIRWASHLTARARCSVKSVILDIRVSEKARQRQRRGIEESIAGNTRESVDLKREVVGMFEQATARCIGGLRALSGMGLSLDALQFPAREERKGDDYIVNGSLDPNDAVNFVCDMIRVRWAQCMSSSRTQLMEPERRRELQDARRRYLRLEDEEAVEAEGVMEMEFTAKQILEAWEAKRKE
ncbi:hypothetical protein LTR85_007247 [Meristemomyces frigidus]|nr:hypothetical protein LTR85_007247 [Meristemomyces frigidus]